MTLSIDKQPQQQCALENLAIRLSEQFVIEFSYMNLFDIKGHF
jgi:hypothetical protein